MLWACGDDLVGLGQRSGSLVFRTTDSYDNQSGTCTGFSLILSDCGISLEIPTTKSKVNLRGVECRQDCALVQTPRSYFQKNVLHKDVMHKFLPFGCGEVTVNPHLVHCVSSFGLSVLFVRTVNFNPSCAMSNADVFIFIGYTGVDFLGFPLHQSNLLLIHQFQLGE
uniref:ZP domain-containing protein n=1 Tax=Steinernema glaseri TaxID=37863 RepID=A0A1I8AGW8_9BILA